MFYCPVCGAECEYDEVNWKGSEVVDCMECSDDNETD